jgi:hypothetical protein
MGAAQYFMATYGTAEQLLSKASHDLEESQRVAAVKSEVETALRNIKTAAEMSITNPKGYYRIAAGLVKNNPHIVGAGAAFRPDYFKSQGLAKLYAPYVYDRQHDVKAKKKKTTEPMLTATLLLSTIPPGSGMVKRLTTARVCGRNPTLTKAVPTLSCVPM